MPTRKEENSETNRWDKSSQKNRFHPVLGKKLLNSLLPLYRENQRSDPRLQKPLSPTPA
jgi:hypothetical protein